MLESGAVFACKGQGEHRSNHYKQEGSMSNIVWCKVRLAVVVAALSALGALSVSWTPSSVNWNKARSVNWSSVNWNRAHSVNWSSVNWNRAGSVNWSSVNWNRAQSVNWS